MSQQSKSQTYKLYGIPASLYTGKVRSYMRKQKIPFMAYGANHREFTARVIPDSALHRTVSLLFELFGGEGLLRPTMHYRWNFDEDNLDFIGDEFVAGMAPPGVDTKQGEKFFAGAGGRMRRAAMSFGVCDGSKHLIESSYAEFLGLFSAHLKEPPYLLGGHPPSATLD